MTSISSNADPATGIDTRRCRIDRRERWEPDARIAKWARAA
jgi:DNA/RNA endonuclease G (NUC1)